MNEKVKAVLDGILERFKLGDIPEAVALASYPVADIPSAQWSFFNRTAMFLAGTADARGFRQWKEVNRYVRKGARAFHILVPCFYKKEDEQGEERHFLGGFKCAPVFRYEDTEGEELDYKQIKLPEIPLLERAEEWGLLVKTIPGNYRYQGYFSPGRREIALATPEESVFFHELAHAGHEKVKKGLKPGQDPFQEIVAELSAQALCRLVGKSANDTIGNSYRYIESYAKKIKMSAFSACFQVLTETEKVLNLILKGGDPECAKVATAPK